MAKKDEKRSIIVTFNYGVNEEMAMQLVKKLGLEISDYIESTETAIVEVPIGSERHWKKEFQKEDIVRTVSLPKTYRTC